MYDVWDYLGQLEDRVRVDAYLRALRASVRPGDVVLDLGCGFGAFAVLAARLGARRVYGVDPSSFVGLGEDLARANGVADRITWFRGGVEDVVFPEAPTLVVADVRGALPFYSGALAVWNAVLGKLAPGARTIPRRDVVLAAPVRSDRLHRRARGSGPVDGVSLAALARALTSHEAALQGDEVPLAEPRAAFEMRYGAPFRLPWTGHVEFPAPGAWTLDGFAISFEADLAEGVTYRSMGPGAARVYPVHVLPTEERVEVVPGTKVALRLRVEGEEQSPSVLWAVDVGPREGAWQGRMASHPLWLDVLHSASPDHVPGPDPRDDLDARLLAAFARNESVAQAIASAARESPGTALDRVERRALELSRLRQRRRVHRFGAGA